MPGPSGLLSSEAPDPSEKGAGVLALGSPSFTSNSRAPVPAGVALTLCVCPPIKNATAGTGPLLLSALRVADHGLLGRQLRPSVPARREGSEALQSWKEAEYGNEEEEQAGGRKMDIKVHCQGRCELSRDLPMPAWRQQCSGPSEAASDSAGIGEDWGPSLSSSISGLQSNSLPTPSRLHPGSMTLHWPRDCARSSDPRPREGLGCFGFLLGPWSAPPGAAEDARLHLPRNQPRLAHINTTAQPTQPETGETYKWLF